MNGKWSGGKSPLDTIAQQPSESTDRTEDPVGTDGCGTHEKHPCMAFALVWADEHGETRIGVGYDELVVKPCFSRQKGVGDAITFRCENDEGKREVRILGDDLANVYRHLLLGKRFSIQENGKEVRQIIWPPEAVKEIKRTE